MTPGAPVPLSEADRQKLIDYLDKELGEALPTHHTREQQLDEWDRRYQAKSETAKKQWPWDGACNIVIPLIATTTDSIEARIVNTIFAPDPFWSVRPLHKDFAALARPTQDFLDWSRRVEFNLYPPVKSCIKQTVKYGTSWLKPLWEVSSRAYFQPTEDGKAVRQDKVLRRPNVCWVSDRDVIRQVGVDDESQAEWIAHRLRFTDGQLWWRRKDRYYGDSDEAIEDVINHKEDVTFRESFVGSVPSSGTGTTPKLNTMYEVYVDFPLGNDKCPVSLVITYHQQTRRILKAIYNPDYYGQRPLVKMRFVLDEERPDGVGIAGMLADLEDEITTVHRQQVDNATLANTRFFVGKRGAIKPGTRIYPGRFLMTANPKEDISVLQLGDIYPSMRALEVSILAFSERRSGVTDYQLGRESSVVGSRATATGTLAIIQEGNRRFDLNVRDMRDSLSEIGKRILQLNQQFRPKGLAYFVQGEDGLLTEQTLDLPPEFIEHRLGVELTASTATINKDVEKQGLMALMGQLMQLGQVGQQIEMLVANPQVPAAMKEYNVKYYEGLATLMKRIAATFDQKDTDALVPMLAQEAMQDGAVGAGQLGPGGPGAAPPSGQNGAGMGQLLGVPQGTA